MSRSGYSDDSDDPWALIRYRGAVVSATRGKRGQAFFLEMARVLDAMPVKELHANLIHEEGAVCAMGAVATARGLDVSKFDPEDSEDTEALGKALGIAPCLAREIAYENDDCRSETPVERWKRMRDWVNDNLLPNELPPAPETSTTSI